MTVRTAVATVAGCCLLFAGLGAGLGWGLGTSAPGYVWNHYRDGPDPHFDPVAFGVAEWVTNGAVGGTMAGLAVVALLGRRAPAGAATPAPLSDPSPPRPEGYVARRLFLTATSLALVTFCLCAGLAVGEGRERGRRYSEEREALAEPLGLDPAFEGVQVREWSAGGVYLVGDVPTAADRDRLRGMVARALGERRAAEVIVGVAVTK